MTAAINAKPPIGLLRFVRRAREATEIPIGATVRTPTGALARVEGYRGVRRGHRLWLYCRYLTPGNKRFDTVLVLPELVAIVEEETV